MPKGLLVQGLVTTFENGRLKVADGLPGAGALIRELRAFKVKITKHRRLTFEGAGEHDDLVTAVALAVWWAAMQKVLGRPRVAPKVEQAIRDARSQGKGMLKIARELGVGTGTVERVIREGEAG